jgi:hypothetical protein
MFVQEQHSGSGASQPSQQKPDQSRPKRPRSSLAVSLQISLIYRKLVLSANHRAPFSHHHLVYSAFVVERKKSNVISSSLHVVAALSQDYLVVMLRHLGESMAMLSIS